MSFFLHSLLSMSVLIPVAATIIKMRVINRSYIPFIILIYAGFFNEVLTFIKASKGEYTLVYLNVFSLVEVLLLLWQFKLWELIGSRFVFYLTMIVMILLWITESLLSTSIFTKVNTLYILVSSSCIMLFSIQLHTSRMFANTNKLKFDPKFIISIGLMLYFFYIIIVEAFLAYGAGITKDFRIWMQEIFAYVNFITNCLFAIAILCFKPRQRYIVQW